MPEEKKIPFEDVVNCFDLPIAVAAKELDTCATVLKKLCRRHGVKRWPYRKLKGLRKADYRKSVVFESIFTKGVPAGLLEKIIDGRQKVQKPPKKRATSSDNGVPTTESAAIHQQDIPPGYDAAPIAYRFSSIEEPVQALVSDPLFAGTSEQAFTNFLSLQHPSARSILSAAFSLGALQGSFLNRSMAEGYAKAMAGTSANINTSSPFGAFSGPAALSHSTAAAIQPSPSNALAFSLFKGAPQALPIQNGPSLSTAAIHSAKPAEVASSKTSAVDLPSKSNMNAETKGDDEGDDNEQLSKLLTRPRPPSQSSTGKKSSARVGATTSSSRIGAKPSNRSAPSVPSAVYSLNRQQQQQQQQQQHHQQQQQLATSAASSSAMLHHNHAAAVSSGLSSVPPPSLEWLYTRLDPALLSAWASQTRSAASTVAMSSLNGAAEGGVASQHYNNCNVAQPPLPIEHLSTASSLQNVSAGIVSEQRDQPLSSSSRATNMNHSNAVVADSR